MALFVEVELVNGGGRRFEHGAVAFSDVDGVLVLRNARQKVAQYARGTWLAARLVDDGRPAGGAG